MRDVPIQLLLLPILLCTIASTTACDKSNLEATSSVAVAQTQQQAKACSIKTHKVLKHTYVNAYDNATSGRVVTTLPTGQAGKCLRKTDKRVQIQIARGNQVNIYWIDAATVNGF